MKKLVFAMLIMILTAGLFLGACAEPEEPTEPAKPAEPAEPAKPAEPAEPAKPTEPSAEGPQSGGILRIIDIEFITSPIGYLPELQFNGVPFMYPCFESFLDFDIKNNPVPILATSWEFSPDYKTLTFHLRKGVKFHDGSDFNAAAAIWNMQNNIDAKVSGTENWESIEAVDDYTVRINLKQYTALVLADIPNLTKTASKEAFDKNGIEWAKWNPVGTGPFKFKEFKKDESIEWERFDDYWGDKAYLDGVKFTYVADRTTAELALQGGQADGLHAMGGSHLSAYTLEPLGFNIVLPGCMYPSLGFDTANEGTIFSDKRVRMAFEYAIDKKKICQSVGYGYWDPMYWPSPEIETGYDASFTDIRDYDPEMARQLLADAGHPDGLETTIYAAVHLSGDHMESIQNYLADVGITAKIEEVSASRWVEAMFGGWTDIFLLIQASSEVESLSSLNRMYGPTAMMNQTLKPPAGLRDLVAEMLLETDDAKRAAMAKEAYRMLFDDCTYVPLWDTKALYALDPKIHDDGIMDWALPFHWNWNKVWMEQ